MKQGMLWYDNQPNRAVELRIQNAVDYFIKKYGHPPLCCFVHPDMIKNSLQLKNNIKVMPNERILKNHIWLEICQD